MATAPPTTTPRQEEILDRTFELVRESGLANLTMKKVADRMGAAMDRTFDEIPEVPGEPPRRRLALPLVGFSIATAVQRRLIPQMSLSDEETLELARLVVR